MDPKSLACSFATLVTNDDYVSGALTLAHSLRSNGTSHEIVVLCPPNALSNRSLSLLYRAFDRIIYVPLWTNRSNKENLQLLGRPELDITYSKLHVFNPAYLEYSTVCFIDADAFALQNCDSIFDLLSPDMHFAAAPDVGWPDSFNSGVFVLRPNAQIYESLVWHATYGAGSWDGGDQGLLNRFFKSWSGFPGKETELSISADAPPQPVCPTEFTRAARLPFIYNVTPSAIYSYLPAVKEFQSDMTIIHFAGHDKPWNQSRFTDGTVWSRSLSPEIVTLHNAWWKARDGLSLKWQEEDRAHQRMAQSVTASRVGLPEINSSAKDRPVQYIPQGHSSHHIHVEQNVGTWPQKYHQNEEWWNPPGNQQHPHRNSVRHPDRPHHQDCQPLNESHNSSHEEECDKQPQSHPHQDKQAQQQGHPHHEWQYQRLEYHQSTQSEQQGHDGHSEQQGDQGQDWHGEQQGHQHHDWQYQRLGYHQNTHSEQPGRQPHDGHSEQQGHQEQDWQNKNDLNKATSSPVSAFNDIFELPSCNVMAVPYYTAKATHSYDNAFRRSSYFDTNESATKPFQSYDQWYHSASDCGSKYLVEEKPELSAQEHNTAASEVHVPGTKVAEISTLSFWQTAPTMAAAAESNLIGFLATRDAAMEDKGDFLADNASVEFKTSRYEWSNSEALPPSLSRKTSRSRLNSVSGQDGDVFYVVVPKDSDRFDEMLGDGVRGTSKELTRVDRHGVPLLLKQKFGKTGSVELVASNVRLMISNETTVCNILAVTTQFAHDSRGPSARSSVLDLTQLGRSDSYVSRSSTPTAFDEHKKRGALCISTSPFVPPDINEVESPSDFASSARYLGGAIAPSPTPSGDNDGSRAAIHLLTAELKARSITIQALEERVLALTAALETPMGSSVMGPVPVAAVVQELEDFGGPSGTVISKVCEKDEMKGSADLTRIQSDGVHKAEALSGKGSLDFKRSQHMQTNELRDAKRHNVESSFAEQIGLSTKPMKFAQDVDQTIVPDSQSRSSSTTEWDENTCSTFDETLSHDMFLLSPNNLGSKPDHEAFVLASEMEASSSCSALDSEVLDEAVDTNLTEVKGTILDAVHTCGSSNVILHNPGDAPTTKAVSKRVTRQRSLVIPSKEQLRGWREF